MVDIEEVVEEAIVNLKYPKNGHGTQIKRFYHQIKLLQKGNSKEGYK
jgi:hypothetical protein